MLSAYGSNGSRTLRPRVRGASYPAHMSGLTTFSALLARERIATLHAEAGRPPPRDDPPARSECVPSSPAALLPLRWIPGSAEDVRPPVAGDEGRECVSTGSRAVGAE